MKLSLRLLIVLIIVVLIASCSKPEPFVVNLWENGAPGFEQNKDEPEQAEDYWVNNIHNPNLTVFLPPVNQATGAGVVVCPGGGMRLLVYEAEGIDAAEYLNSIGVAAFVLKYRLPMQEGSPYTFNHVQEDIFRAMRVVRFRAEEWGVEKDKIGVMGFSAGGVLASLVSFHPGEGDAHAEDPVDRVNANADFLISVYPGDYGIPEVLPECAPLAFFVTAIDDEYGCQKPVIRLMKMYDEAQKPAEVHIYARGKHAFNMGQRTDLISIKTWPERIEPWMIDNEIINK